MTVPTTLPVTTPHVGTVTSLRFQIAVWRGGGGQCRRTRVATKSPHWGR